MMQNTLPILNALRLPDVLDIAIVAVMISVLLIWFKDRASRFVFIGVSVVGAIYLAARFFQFYLTTIALQGFFAILLFILVVIFQEDLRRFFERLAVLSRLGKEGLAQDASYDIQTEMIVETAMNLARNHIGALIVIKGNDPLDRHINAGTVLDGLPTQMLLESLFDPHSPGHDGAVLIDGTRLARFGCHLPLSGNADVYGIYGLRHTSALGLAERSDALCIVVSEERGIVSVAQDGMIQEVNQAAMLRNRLNAFYNEKFPPDRSSLASRWLKKNTREKVIAVVLACILWLMFGYQKETIRRDFAVPVEYLNVSRQIVIAEPKVTDVRVVLAGPSQAFQFLPTDSLKVSLNLSHIREGHQTIVLTKDMMKIPSNLSVVGIYPHEMTVTASRLIPVSVPIEIRTKNKVPKGFSVQQMSVVPSSVRVLVPSDAPKKRITIQTEEIDLAKIIDTNTVLKPDLRFPSSIQFEMGKPPSVQVMIKSGKAAVQPRETRGGD